MTTDKTFPATTAMATIGFGDAAHAASCDQTFSFTGAIETCTTVRAGTPGIAALGA